jgi:two-component system LytT family response regulator
MNLLSVIIADDDRLGRARLRRLLTGEPDVDIVSECNNGKDALQAILDHSPDLAFLDVEMPQLTGFQVVQALPDHTAPGVVFLSALDRYAVDAFAVGALDYLLKPLEAGRLQTTLRRARKDARAGASDRDLHDTLRQVTEGQREVRDALTNLRDSSGASTRDAYIERFAVKSDGRIFYVRVDDVDYIESAGNYVRLHAGAETHMLRERVTELALRLDPARFARIHRGTIVNLDRIKEIQPWFSGDALVILRSGMKLRLSRLFRSALDLGPRSRKSLRVLSTG